MDDELKRKIREMARKKQDEMQELNVNHFIEAKNGEGLSEEEIEKLTSIKHSFKHSIWSLPKSTSGPTICGMEIIPKAFTGIAETEDEMIYPSSECGLDFWGSVFEGDEWFGSKLNRTVLALTNDQFIVWNVDDFHHNELRKFLNVSDFIDKFLDIRPRDIRWAKSYVLIEHPNVWYRGTISWKRKTLERVKAAQSIVFRQLHEDIWNYLSIYNIDPNELEFFDLLLDTYDPTLPLNDYEISKVYNVGIETFELSHKLFSMSSEVPDIRKKTFKPFGDGGLFEIVYKDDEE